MWISSTSVKELRMMVNFRSNGTSNKLGSASLLILTIALCFTFLVEVNGAFESKWRNDEACGTRMMRTAKIINGSTAIHGRYPWLVQIQLNNRHHCGGSLIREDWVVTVRRRIKKNKKL